MRHKRRSHRRRQRQTVSNTGSITISESSSSRPISRARIQQFPRHIHTGKIVARIGFGIAHLARAGQSPVKRLIPSSSLPKIKEATRKECRKNFCSSSPAFSGFCRFSITGKPAPALVSYQNLRRDCARRRNVADGSSPSTRCSLLLASPHGIASRRKSALVGHHLTGGAISNHRIGR